jgi:hypothetical protein
MKINISWLCIISFNKIVHFILFYKVFIFIQYLRQERFSQTNRYIIWKSEIMLKLIKNDYCWIINRNFNFILLWIISSSEFILFIWSHLYFILNYYLMTFHFSILGDFTSFNFQLSKLSKSFHSINDVSPNKYWNTEASSTVLYMICFGRGNSQFYVQIIRCCERCWFYKHIFIWWNKTNLRITLF